MSNNRIKVIPETVYCLPRLQYLSLSRNQIRYISPSISKLTELVDLDLDHNQLTAVPDSIGELKQLQRLMLQGNRLTTIQPEILAIPSLERINLRNNLLPFSQVQLNDFPRPPQATIWCKYDQQDEHEESLWNAICRGYKEIVRTILKAMVQDSRSEIDFSKLRDKKGDNLLHFLVQSAMENIQAIRSELTRLHCNNDISDQDKAESKALLEQKLKDVEQLYTTIFGTLIQFGGTQTQEMLLTRNKNGDDVITAVYANFGPDSLLLKTIQRLLMDNYIPTPIGEHLKPFKITSRSSATIVPPTEQIAVDQQVIVAKEATQAKEHEQKRIERYGATELKEREEKKATQEQRSEQDKAHRARALRVLGLNSDQDDRDIIETQFRKLSATLNSVLESSSARPDQHAQANTKLKELTRAFHYLTIGLL